MWNSWSKVYLGFSFTNVHFLGFLDIRNEEFRQNSIFFYPILTRSQKITCACDFSKTWNKLRSELTWVSSWGGHILRWADYCWWTGTEYCHYIVSSSHIPCIAVIQLSPSSGPGIHDAWSCTNTNERRSITQIADNWPFTWQSCAWFPVSQTNQLW